MASSSGTSSGSSHLQNSGSEGDLRTAAVDQRKQKRMLSNRESARRSRMRKQKHLDDLMTQVSQLRKENNQILTALNVTTQHYLGVESENSVLRTQMLELSTRLQSLNEIIQCINVNNCSGDGNGAAFFLDELLVESDNGFLKPWNNMMMMDMFQYC